MWWAINGFCESKKFTEAIKREWCMRTCAGRIKDNPKCRAEA
jgi:hypothetical protein